MLTFKSPRDISKSSTTLASKLTAVAVSSTSAPSIKLLISRKRLKYWVKLCNAVFLRYTLFLYGRNLMVWNKHVIRRFFPSCSCCFMALYSEAYQIYHIILVCEMDTACAWIIRRLGMATSFSYATQDIFFALAYNSFIPCVCCEHARC